MPEPANPGATPAPAPTDAALDALYPEGKPPAKAEKGESPEELRAERDRLKAEHDRLKAEDADRRKKLAAYEADEAKRKKEAMSEAERLKAEADEAKVALESARAELNAERIGAAVRAEAAAQGFEYPEDAPRLVNLEKVEIDEDGKVKGVKAVVEDLARRRPGLVKAGVNNPARVPGTPRRGTVNAAPGNADGRTPEQQEARAQYGRGRYPAF